MPSATSPKSNSFEDKLLYMELPTDPPGDPREPYVDYAKQRKECPVQIVAERFGPGSSPFAYLYKHADIVKVLQDNETFSSKINHDFMSAFMGEYFLVGLDEPVHGHYRNLLAPSLRPALIARWEEKLISAIADKLIDAIAEKGQADLVTDFNFSYPALVVANIIGVPQEDFAQFQYWAMDIVGALGDPEAGLAATQALRAYLAPFLEDRRKNPQDDIMTELVSVELDGAKLNDEEIYSFLLLLLPAGIETTFRSLGNLFFNLLTNPDQMEAVRGNRSLVAAAIEENLRLEPPIQYPPRIATQNVELSGVPVSAGTVVVPIISAANHDPDFIDDPDRFNIHRPSIRHITFGNGVHTCMGLHLAKLETRIALNKILDRLPGLRLDKDKAAKQDAHIRGKMFRSPTALPVLWDA